MSVYAYAAQQGISSLNLLMGGQNAGTIGAYNAAYQAEAQRGAARSAINTAESNIAAINQDTILTNAAIDMAQKEATANAAVSAAAAGVSGGSVDAVAYGIDANASMQKQNVEARADQLTEQQLAAVNSGSIALSSVQDQPVPTMMDGLMTTASQVTNQDLKTAKTFLEEDGPTMNVGANNDSLWYTTA